MIFLILAGITLLSCDVAFGRRSSEGRHTGKRDFCNSAPERGICRASRLRWHYDSAIGECRNFTWGGCGGNENKFVTQSFCERVCKPGCRNEICNITCSHGYIMDESGCNTCRCRQDPALVCPEIECDTSCPNGYLTDAEGCRTCDCASGNQPRVIRSSPQHQCPPVCYMFCQYGNKKDADGCDTCSCISKAEFCGSEHCLMECPSGFATDSRGCDLCECKTDEESAPSCSNNKCLKECAFGLQKDSFGCEICVCATSKQRSRSSSSGRWGGRRNSRKDSKNERRSGKAPSSEDVCGVRPMCSMFCPNGFVKDRKGCDTCACRSDSKVRPAHLPARTKADTPSQQPAGRPSQIPANIPAQLPGGTDCPSKGCHKRMTCSFGFAKDEFGCDTCVCSDSRSRAATRRRNSKS